MVGRRRGCPLFTSRGPGGPTGKADTPRGHGRVTLRDARCAPGRIMGRRVVCGREPPHGVARVEVFFSSGACRAFQPRGWRMGAIFYAGSYVFML